MNVLTTELFACIFRGLLAIIPSREGIEHVRRRLQMLLKDLFALERNDIETLKTNSDMRR